MPCEALPRKRYHDPNWTCDGTGIVQVMRGPGGIPVVAPESRLAELLSDPEFGGAYDPQPFNGGDHCHVVFTAKLT